MFAPSARRAVAFLFAAAAWALGARLPLGFTDLWAHVAYGRWIATNGLPTTEPLLESCRGMPMPPVDWLWKRLAYQLRTLPGGSANLVLLQAVPLATAAGLLALRMLRTTQSTLVTALGLSVTLLLLREQLIVRPQLVGLAGMAFALWIARLRPARWQLPVVALAFAAWANLHGSWPIGLAVFAVETVLGRRATWRLAAIAAVAVCFNPRGPLLYADTLAFTVHDGVRDLIEWQPLAATPRQERTVLVVGAAVVALVLMVRRVRWADVVLLVLLGAPMLDASRWIVWVAPVAGLVAADLVGRLLRKARLRTHYRPSRGFLAFGVVTLLVAIATTPREAVVAAGTPVETTRFLRDRNVTGRLFNSQELGDTLLWFGPRGSQPLVHSHVHLIRPEVWNAYRAAVTKRGEPLDSYVTPQRFDAVVLARFRHAKVSDQLRAGAWQLAHADDVCVVLVPKR